MFYRLSADLVLIVHLAFVLFVMLGGLLVLRRPRAYMATSAGHRLGDAERVSRRVLPADTAGDDVPGSSGAGAATRVTSSNTTSRPSSTLPGSPARFRSRSASERSC